MSLRVCSTPGCPTLVKAGVGKCAVHRREYEHERGTRQERGYDAEFEQAKRSPEYVTATHCVTCHEPFTADNPKTAGHVKAIREHGPNNAGIVPQCRRCNYGWLRTGS